MKKITKNENLPEEGKDRAKRWAGKATIGAGAETETEGWSDSASAVIDGTAARKASEDTETSGSIEKQLQKDNLKLKS